MGASLRDLHDRLLCYALPGQYVALRQSRTALSAIDTLRDYKTPRVARVGFTQRGRTSMGTVTYRNVDVDGIRVFYREAGPRDGPKVLSKYHVGRPRNR